MPMRDMLDQLTALQTLNAQITRCAKDRDALRIDIEQQHRVVEDLEKRREQLKENRREAQKKADRLDLSTRETEEENDRLQLQLNSTKRQGDYDAIRQKILSNKADISKWEDEELELLQSADDLKNEEVALEETLAAERKKLEAIEGQVAGQSAEYEARISELERQREELRGSIDGEILISYDRLARSRGTTAIAKVKDRLCLGCFTTLPRQTENDLMRGTSMVYCHNCGRMLMLAEEDGA